MSLSAVIPIYNELPTLPELLSRIHATNLADEIIFVNDASTDGTTEYLDKITDKNIRVIHLPTNCGKGAALRAGLLAAQGDVILIQDADLEYDPSDWAALLEPINKGQADVVYGSRFLGQPHRVLYFRHQIANNMLTLLSNLFTDLNLTDMETCYKVFTRKAMEGIELHENRFGFEPEITQKFARKKMRIYEVPIHYHGRTYAEGKKIRWWDGLRAIWVILKYGVLRRGLT